MINSMLTPATIINFIKSNTDIKKIGLNLLNSEQGKMFISQDLGLDYDSFKETMFSALSNVKKSEYGLKQQQQLQNQKKIQAYKELAQTLINQDGLAVYSGVILSAGLFGIDQKQVVEYLKIKGYSATPARIEDYYKKNIGFLKSILKKHGKIIPGFNDKITSLDLQVEQKNQKQLIPVPDTTIEQDIGSK